MRKVYCQNCKYYFYDSPRYLSGLGHQPCIRDICLKLSPIRMDGIGNKLIKRVDAGEQNKNCICSHYARKWYKFWIKEDK